LSTRRRYLAGDVEAVPLLVLTVIAGVLVAGGIVAFRQRDVG